LLTVPEWAAGAAGAKSRVFVSFAEAGAAAAARRQGLSLVHFSAQPEPLLTQNAPLNTPITP